MRSRIFSRKRVTDVIWDMFPACVTLRWTYDRVVTIGYFARGDEMFCCVENQWWKIEYRNAEYDRGEEGIEYYAAIDQIVESNPPEDVTYSHSFVRGLETNDKITDGCYIGGEMGYDLCLDSYPPSRNG